MALQYPGLNVLVFAVLPTYLRFCPTYLGFCRHVWGSARTFSPRLFALPHVFGRAAVPRPCDATGAMCATSLEELVQKSIADGVTPLVVNATAGTTVRGAYDPFDKIGDICEK